MDNDDRRLLVETLAEIRELKGEMKEFKKHVIGRVEKLEKKEGEHSRNVVATVSLLISAGALLVSIVVNFIKSGVQG
jgi:hypothetical protein